MVVSVAGPRIAASRQHFTVMCAAAPCPYRKLYPTILVMKRAEDRSDRNLSIRLDRPMPRRIFVQGQVRPEVVVIAGVGRKNPSQMVLAEDDDVIEAFAANRANQPLRMPVLQG